MILCQLRSFLFDIVSRLTQCLYVENYRIVQLLILHELGHILVSAVALNSLNGIQNLFEEITNPNASLAYTGTASASTLLRNFSGSALGVSTSTVTPKRPSSST